MSPDGSGSARGASAPEAAAFWPGAPSEASLAEDQTLAGAFDTVLDTAVVADAAPSSEDIASDAFEALVPLDALWLLLLAPAQDAAASAEASADGEASAPQPETGTHGNAGVALDPAAAAGVRVQLTTAPQSGLGADPGAAAESDAVDPPTLPQAFTPDETAHAAAAGTASRETNAVAGDRVDDATHLLAAKALPDRQQQDAGKGADAGDPAADVTSTPRQDTQTIARPEETGSAVTDRASNPAAGRSANAQSAGDSMIDARPRVQFEPDTRNADGDAGQQGAAQNPLAQLGAAISADAPAAAAPDFQQTLTVAAAAPGAQPSQGAAASVETALATPMTPEAEVDNINRLVESMRLQTRQGGHEATIRLRPEYFGDVTISIRVEKGVVSAVMRADTPAAQEWLEAQEARLRDGLADQGLILERYVVNRDRQQEQPREQRRQTPARYRARDDEPAERFEVVA